MAITSEYTGGYEVTNIIPKGVYTTQTIITDSVQLIPEDRKSIFSLYYINGFRTSIRISYGLSADNEDFSAYQEIININMIGNYIFFYINTDAVAYIKFKIEITGSAEMEFNQLGVLKGVRTRSFILLEGPNEHRAYPCTENLTVKDNAKLINLSGTLKLAKLRGVYSTTEAEVYNNGSASQIEILGNIVLMCYRDYSTNYLMLRTGVLNPDNSITWQTPIQVYSIALLTVAGYQSFSLAKLTSSKFVIGFNCTGGSSYIVAGDVINGVVTLGSVTSGGAYYTAVPFCSVFRISDTKFIICTSNSSAYYPQYKCVIVGANNTFTQGSYYVPNSVSGSFATGCVIDENNSSGPVFVTGMSFASETRLYTNYVSSQTTVSSGAYVTLNSTYGVLPDFTIEAYNTGRGLVSYFRDTSTHKVAVQFFNITISAITLSDLIPSTYDADHVAGKYLGSGKILHVYSYASSAKSFIMLSDITTNSIAWGTPVEINSTSANLFFSVRAFSGVRYLAFYCNETNHSIRFKIYDDDRNLFIGIMNESGLAGASCEVKIPGQICNKFSGLTPGDQYYIQTDGSLSVAQTGFSAGVAVSDMEILVKK